MYVLILKSFMLHLLKTCTAHFITSNHTPVNRLHFVEKKMVQVYRSSCIFCVGISLYNSILFVRMQPNFGNRFADLWIYGSASSDVNSTAITLRIDNYYLYMLLIFTCCLTPTLHNQNPQCCAFNQVLEIFRISFNISISTYKYFEIKIIC